uniref:Glutathione S-transferase domain n=1 Tax=Caulobacter sp. (strain K31) TaxID=366602 RepID=B0T3X3_CAUSK
MITLYHCVGARSFRALWALEELGLPYALKLTAFPPRLREPGYLDVNPLGTTPALIDGETLMSESAAIGEYLARRHGPSDLTVASDEPGFGAYLNFLHMGEATLTFPQTIHLRYAVFEPEERRLPQAAADYVQWFLSRLKGAARLLDDTGYVAAGRFTMADISVAYALKLGEQLGFSDKYPEAFAAHLERMKARPAYQRALAAESAGEPVL